jgi:hypothetical protein
MKNMPNGLYTSRFSIGGSDGLQQLLSFLRAYPAGNCSVNLLMYHEKANWFSAGAVDSYLVAKHVSLANQVIPIRKRALPGPREIWREDGVKRIL